MNLRHQHVALVQPGGVLHGTPVLQRQAVATGQEFLPSFSVRL